MGQKVGQKIGKYEIVAELGQGGMGVVYKARDPFIGRMVALKTIAPELVSDKEILQRFKREAQSAGTLQHPNIVTIYDLGEAEGLPYIAMEFVEGESVQSIINRRARIPLAAKLKLVQQFCEGLGHAHKFGFVHRDVKPANILVTHDGNVKVVDFGIVHLDSAANITKTGTFLGTIHYASPEQINDGHVDSRSDLWSVTCVVYEFIAYMRAFDGSNVAAVIGKILTREPEPLSRCCPGVPAALDPIISKGLRKNIDDRYQSLDEMLGDLIPISRGLQQSFIGDLIVEARDLRDKGDFNAARDKVRAALILDSTHGEAKRLQTEISQAALRLAPDAKVRRLVTEAEQAFNRGDIAESLRILAEVQGLNPADAQARNLMQKAVAELNRLRELREALGSGQKAMMQGDLTGAEKDLNRALQLDQNNSQAAELLGRIQQDRQGRERDFRLKEALWQADDLVYAGSYEDAHGQLVELQKEFPDSDDIRLKLQILRPLIRVRELAQEGQHAFQQGEFGEAVRLFTEALRLDPHDRDVRDLKDRAIAERDRLRVVRAATNTGQQVIREGEDGAADLEFQKAFQLDSTPQQAAPVAVQIHPAQPPQNREGWLRATFQRYDDNLTAGKFDEAEIALFEMQSEFPASTPVGQKLLVLERQLKMARLLAESQQAYSEGEFGEAVRLLNEAQELDPSDARVPELKAQAVKERDRLRQVRDAISSGQRAVRQGSLEVAEQELQRAVQLDPANSQASTLLAQVKADRQERDHAQRLTAELIQVEKLLAANKFDEAGRILAELQQANPSDEVKARLQKLNQWKAEAIALATRPTPVSTQTAPGSPATASLLADELRRSLQAVRSSGPGAARATPGAAAQLTPSGAPSASAASPAAEAPKAVPTPSKPSATSMFGASANTDSETQPPAPPARPRT